MGDDQSIESLKREDQAVAQVIGIEMGCRPLVTLYNPASGMIVASVERYSSEAFDRRLFFRHTSERAYRRIETPAPDIHYDDLISSSTLPVIYYAVHRVTKSEAPGEFGADTFAEHLAFACSC